MGEGRPPPSPALRRVRGRTRRSDPPGRRDRGAACGSRRRRPQSPYSGDAVGLAPRGAWRRAHPRHGSRRLGRGPGGRAGASQHGAQIPRHPRSRGAAGHLAGARRCWTSPPSSTTREIERALDRMLIERVGRPQSDPRAPGPRGTTCGTRCRPAGHRQRLHHVHLHPLRGGGAISGPRAPGRPACSRSSTSSASAMRSTSSGPTTVWPSRSTASPSTARATASRTIRRRDAELRKVGITVIRITWRQLERESEAVLVDVAQALARTAR